MSGLAFDVVILDVMMPGENGLELARDLKGTSNVPICMLTARAEPEERIQGLEIGVDDYVAKPFEPRELLLRLQNILKRRQGPSGPRDEITMGDYTFHVARGELKRGEESIKLTERERELLRQFAQRPGTPIARHELAADEFHRHRARRRRADQSPAPQDRERSGQSGLFADGERQGVHPLHRLDGGSGEGRTCSLPVTGPGAGRRVGSPSGRALWAGAARMLAELAPKGLYARALIIIIAPIVLLESVVAFTFMERHWNQVTRRLSEATARNIAAIVDLYESHAYEDSRLEELAKNRFGLSLTVMTARRAAEGAASSGRSSTCSTARCPRRSRCTSSGRSGSIRSASPRTWRSGSSSTARSCASPRGGRSPTPPTPTSS